MKKKARKLKNEIHNQKSIQSEPEIKEMMEFKQNVE